jgi:hypothetical protein
MASAIQAWDHEDTPDWSGRTKQYTVERRKLILDLLGFSSDQEILINNKIPRFSETEIPIVIARSHKPWYYERKLDIKNFYWDHYRSHLEKSWSDAESIRLLDASIDDVISRLSDPFRPEIYQVKGLVMGYVQSGKTSHYGGLIAKAADAGYRLVIVLAGTMDILRQQTQRRIDKEIVGRELLGPDEYGMDDDWYDFVSHDGIPSEKGYFDWERLTNKYDDYISLCQYLAALDFKSMDRTKRFNHPDNLRNAPAKLAVIKKVPPRINKLCRDLRRLGELRSKLEHVPTLIIDDESDLASVNTVDQSKPGKEGQRTSTNKAIGELLKLLPRAQYVGYTATPFANVFIDPEDAEDLFPKDFIISLPKPRGYMGITDFFDFDNQFNEGDFRGNRNAFIRPVEGIDSDPDNLPTAIDAFILSGAIKLYRIDRNPVKFKNQFKQHTMLVHHSSRQIVHEEDRKIVEDIFAGGSRYQRKEGIDHLKKLFTHDFMPVSHAREPDLPFPETFDELKPFISRCLSRVLQGKSVRIVNGAGKNRDDTPDFEQSSVWAILVGGTKLSRGYTIEGLTVSYYRRPTGAGDTLMQMGRWFGFRAGYKDLVRLFIGVKEQRQRKEIDLYEYYSAVCRDEEALRSELLRYSREGLLPYQVPPLVHQHLPGLRPTSKNKMFNAEIRSQDFAGTWTEKTIAPILPADIQANRTLAAALLNRSRIYPDIEISYTNQNGLISSFDAIMGVVAGEEIVDYLKKYRWEGDRKPVNLEIDYIELMMGQNKLKKWLILLPLLRSEKLYRLSGTNLANLTVVERQRVENRFNVYSEPHHRKAAAFLSGVEDIQNPARCLLDFRNTESAVMVLYFVREKNKPDSDVNIGFGIQYPGHMVDNAITWTVRVRNNEDAVVSTT